MYKDLLPVGSVVMLKEGKKRLMICGRVVTKAGSDQIYDYIGSYYPEGIVNASEMFFFNQDAIETVYFIGYQDQEEMAFRTEVLGLLDGKELVVIDGQIGFKE